MFFRKVNDEQEKEDNSSICVVGSLKSNISDHNEIFELEEDKKVEVDVKVEEKEGDVKEDDDNETTCTENEDEFTSETKDKLNEDDDLEDNQNKIYIISIDTIPYFYENELQTARDHMWKLADKIINEKKDEYFDNSRYIFTNDLNKISVISPYNFLGLNYHQTICELDIHYVIKYEKQ